MRTIKLTSCALVAGLVLLASADSVAVDSKDKQSTKEERREEKATRGALRRAKSGDIQKQIDVQTSEEKASNENAKAFQRTSEHAAKAHREVANAHGQAADALKKLAQEKATQEEKNPVGQLLDVKGNLKIRKQEKAAAKAIHNVRSKNRTATQEGQKALIKEQLRQIK